MGQSPNWKNVKVDVAQGSVWGPLLFIIYINDLTQGLHSDVKFFADNMSLFPVVDDIDEPTSKLNNDPIRIHDWVYKKKMPFNSERAKPAQEVIFSWKTKNITYPNLYFKGLPIVKIASQKYLVLNLDAMLTFNNQVNEKKWQGNETCWSST